MKGSACILEECQASERRRRRITAQSPRFSRRTSWGATLAWAPRVSCAFGVKYSGRAYKSETFKSLHWTKDYSVKNEMDYSYSHEVSQQTVFIIRI